MTAVDIIKETCSYYEEDPPGRRAVIGMEEECVYESGDGKMCSVGRCMLPEKRKLLIDQTQLRIQDVLTLLDAGHIDELLLEPYRGHPLEFWMDLQCLHDDRDFWDKNQPGKKRKAYTAALLRKYYKH